MNNSVYIYHHLGLGDHIIANGMVRTIAKKYNRVFLFCKPRNIKNVAIMYKDLLNLKLIGFEMNQIEQFMSINPNEKYIIAGHGEFWKIFNSPSNKLKIDEIFYNLAGVPLKNKWDEFYIPRNLDKEKDVFHKLGLKEGDKYAFVHDDSSRRISINVPNIKIIRPENKEYSIFDFIYTIEKAEEIHCINSSFFCMIDLMKIKKDKMYLHEYVRGDLGHTKENATPILGMPWEIIK